jgi:hypothetical protein
MYNTNKIVIVLAIVIIVILITNSNVSKKEPFNTSLYEFKTHTFTNAGKSGRLGPIFIDIRNAYSEIPWAMETMYLYMEKNDGIQLWTVPKTGEYVIEAIGASGNIKLYNIGNGIHVKTTVTLKKGDIIKILVGQQGNGTGGGGGTFVTTKDNEPIIVAGGGGGWNYGDESSVIGYENDAFENIPSNGNINSNGLKTKSTPNNSEHNSGDVESDGDAGYGGGGSKFAGGGGGFYKDGIDARDSTGGIGGFSFIEGGRGGRSSEINRNIDPDKQYYWIKPHVFNNCDGGFGGGGGGWNLGCGGGGGGYSGGGGGGIIGPGAWKMPWLGGGGGSYSSTPTTFTFMGYSVGPGKVIISLSEHYKPLRSTPVYESRPIPPCPSGWYKDGNQCLQICENNNQSRHPDGTCVCHTGHSWNTTCNNNFSCISKRCTRFTDPTLPLPKPDMYKWW